MAGRTMTGLMAVMADAGYMTAKARGDAIADLTIRRGVPNAGVADAYVEETILDVLEQVGDLDQVASARELEAARVAVDHAKQEREAFVRLASALDADSFRAGYEERRAREAEAADAYDALLEHAADVEALPTSASVWQALDEPARRRIARPLIDAVVVSPPLSRSRFAGVTERFAIRWARSGELAGAGR